MSADADVLAEIARLTCTFPSLSLPPPL